MERTYPFVSFPRKRESSASDSEHMSQKMFDSRSMFRFLTYVARRRGPLDSRFRGNDTGKLWAA